jgi:hypothetical protein
VLQKFELVVKMINGTDPAAISDSPYDTGGEDHNPQYGYQNQQDHS